MGKPDYYNILALTAAVLTLVVIMQQSVATFTNDSPQLQSQLQSQEQLQQQQQLQQEEARQKNVMYFEPTNVMLILRDGTLVKNGRQLPIRDLNSERIRTLRERYSVSSVIQMALFTIMSGQEVTVIQALAGDVRTPQSFVFYDDDDTNPSVLPPMKSTSLDGSDDASSSLSTTTHDDNNGLSQVLSAKNTLYYPSDLKSVVEKQQSLFVQRQNQLVSLDSRRAPSLSSSSR
jgi:heme exporter protein D